MPDQPLTRYALLSIGAAVVTLALKLGAWQITGSVSLLSDALESLANLAAALIAFASLTIAARPEDDDHPYGHTKVEYMAGAVEGALIIGAAAGIAWSATDRFLRPAHLHDLPVGLTVSALASALNLAVARILLKVGRERRSVALEADARHLMTDVWTSAVTLPAVLLAGATSWNWLDPAIGLVLAVHIVFTGAGLVHRSAQGLLDTGLPEPELAAIRTVLDGHHPEGITWHALRTREAGARRFLSVHILVPGHWSVREGHDCTERIEAELRRAVPGLHVLTHLEPDEDPASWNDIPLDR